MQIIIEPVKTSEIALLANLSRKTFYDTFETYNTVENMEMFLKNNLTINALSDEMSQPYNAFFFARTGAGIAGYLKLSTKRTPVELGKAELLEIARIYVVKEAIGSGIGKVLMDFALSYAMQSNKEIIWLGVWEHNLKAINFYRRFGFEKFGQHIFLVGDDPQTDWLMKKELVLGS